jgi:hypothetical protein
MNPVSIQQVYRAESSQRSRQIAEIQLLNQAYPRRDHSSEGRRAFAGSMSWVRQISRRLRSWIPSRQPQTVSPTESTQAPY